jgi:glycosyltransferase involved in cell wall biosynthesis
LDQEFAEYRLILVGASGPYLDDIRVMIDHEENDKREKVTVVLDAAHSKVIEYMVGASLFVLPSRAEPFGIVLLEAGLATVPVIASRVGGIPEILTHNENGLLVEPGDVGELRLAIETLLSDASLSSKLASQHYQRVVSNFTWKKCAAKYTDLVNSGF